MRARPANPIPLVGLLMLLAAGAGTAAQSRGIRDDGKFLSPDTLKAAEAVIDQIQVVHQKDLCVETFPEIPKELLARFQQQGKEKFFEQWVSDRARAQAVDGVYILICRQPGRIQVWVGDDTARRLFTATDRAALVRKMVEPFHRHAFDEGLLTGVRFVQSRMDARSKASDDPRMPLIHRDLPNGAAHPRVRPLLSNNEDGHGGLPLHKDLPPGDLP